MTAAPHGTGAGIRSFPDAAKGKFMPGPIVRHFISELKWPVALYSFANTLPRSCGSRARNAGGLVNIQNRNLIERFGANIRLPDLRWEISQCSRHGQMHDT